MKEIGKAINVTVTELCFGLLQMKSILETGLTIFKAVLVLISGWIPALLTNYFVTDMLVTGSLV